GLAPASEPASRERRPTRSKAALPTNIQVEEYGQRTVLSWRWFKTQHLLMAFFCVFWDGVLVMWYGSLLTGEGAPLCALLFRLLHVGAGVFLTYSTLAGFLNTTRIEVNRSELTIEHGPLPWPGSRTLPGRELTQLYGQEVRGNKGSLTYSLFALDKQGRK